MDNHKTMFEYSLKNPSHTILKYYGSADNNHLNVVKNFQERIRHRFSGSFRKNVRISEYKIFHKQKHSHNFSTMPINMYYIYHWPFC